MNNVLENIRAKAELRLAGKTTFITGAGNGIGRSASMLFAAHGAKVAIAERSPEQGAAAAADIVENGGEAIFIETDVGDPASVENAIERTVEAFGSLNVIYNNVGGTGPADGPVTEAPFDEFWRAMRVDVFGTWLCCKYGIPHMARAGGGSIVNVSSMVALIGRPGADCYTAAKGAVASLTRSMAVYHAPQNIRVNALAPGATLTERVVRRLEQRAFPQNLLDRHLMGLLQPEDVANVALFLASDESKGMTGQVIPVDSGTSIT